MKIPLVTKRPEAETWAQASGFLILIDKQADWTSFDVCKKIRHITRIKKVGHGGTLDPFATGLMTIGVGRGTKKLHELTALDKRYRAVIRFGISTDSFDITGTVTGEMPDFHLDESTLRRQLRRFTGDVMQLPPMFSAKKVNGQRLYKAARKGREVERQPVAVHVFRAEIIQWEPPELIVDYHVSKGTYIRALAHDLGQSLGVPAVLKALRRTAIGAFTVDEALTIPEFEQMWKQATG
ncbi:MAG: tRNA pseudouridine(55) synthase TruB [Calditrichaeota bacterium]|nr:MAG: tRNA pseudouridine(55) synthase TruB [Calditrichota bacterium]